MTGTFNISLNTVTPTFHMVNLGTKALAFSYGLVIGYFNGTTWTVRQNNWGKTTGQHMNKLDHGQTANRLPDDLFEEGLTSLFGGET